MHGKQSGKHTTYYFFMVWHWNWGREIVENLFFILFDFVLSVILQERIYGNCAVVIYRLIDSL